MRAGRLRQRPRVPRAARRHPGTSAADHHDPARHRRRARGVRRRAQLRRARPRARRRRRAVRGRADRRAARLLARRPRGARAGRRHRHERPAHRHPLRPDAQRARRPGGRLAARVRARRRRHARAVAHPVAAAARDGTGRARALCGDPALRAHADRARARAAPAHGARRDRLRLLLGAVDLDRLPAQRRPVWLRRGRHRPVRARRAPPAH